MHLLYNILPIYYVLLEAGTFKRNVRFPTHGDHFHHSDLAMHHDDIYQPYDESSYSSDEIVMRQSPRRSKYQRDTEYSDSEYNYKCKCSCTKCQKRKPKPKTCCREYCATSCNVQSNILVVPYPVPFMVYNNQSAPELPIATPATTYDPPVTIVTMPPSGRKTPSPPTEPPPTKPTTPQTTPPPRKTLAMTLSTNPYFDKNAFKRFRIINEKNLRRGFGNNGFHAPKFGRLPKYGIVPIPENLALSLMHQLKRDQINDQFRNRLSFDKNHVEYAGLPLV